MYELVPWCTLLLIGGTVIFSFLAFQNPALERRFIFNPESILARKEYYRLVTPAFLHAGWSHLLWNMIGLYSFGRPLEWHLGWAQFLFIYLGSVIAGNLLALFIHRHHEYYAYGASGGVCGVMFAFILLFPGAKVGFLFFPIPIPGWLFVLAFIPISFFGMKTGRGNIGHDAHLGGAIVGLLMAAGLNPYAVRENPYVFAGVLVSAILLLAYLWRNPRLLPGVSILDRPFAWRKPAEPPPHRREALQIDEILDKVSRNGIESLTPEEKAFLDEVSGKYRRRAESKKPESGLTI
jgi:membrane associated rhomboid family serine protease